MAKYFSDSIRKTLVYFDLARYPLTKEELWRNLWQPPSFGYEDFVVELEKNEEKKWQTDRGYYFLPGRAETIENRQRCLWTSEEKIKIAHRAAKKILAVPFVRAVWVCNSVGSGLAEAGSDIDFLIVTAPGRIWIARFFTNLILRLWGLRTYGNKIKNRVCLSFFLDEKHLSLSNLRAREDDIHLAYWVTQMIPLFDSDRIYQKFLQANSWLKKFLPNIIGDFVPVYINECKRGCVGNIWRRVWETMWQGAYGDFVEGQAKALQMQKMKMSLKEKAREPGYAVVISDSVIKLHENDRRAVYYREWQEKICV